MQGVGRAGISETQAWYWCRRVRGRLHPRHLQDMRGARRGRGITGKWNTIFLNRKQHWGAGSRQSPQLRTSASCPQGAHGTWNAVPTDKCSGQGATWLLAPVSWARLTLAGDRSCCVGPRGLATEPQAGTGARPRLRLDTQQARVPRGAHAFQKGFPAQSPEATCPAPSCARLSTGSPRPPENALESQAVGMPQAPTVPAWRERWWWWGVPPATLLQSLSQQHGLPSLKYFNLNFLDPGG